MKKDKAAQRRKAIKKKTNIKRNNTPESFREKTDSFGNIIKLKKGGNTHE